jgi:hypothetical protein
MSLPLSVQLFMRTKKQEGVVQSFCHAAGIQQRSFVEEPSLNYQRMSMHVNALSPSRE